MTTTATETNQLNGEAAAHIFIPLANELPVKEALHKALTTAGYASLPADPQQAHIADYLERVFGDIEGRVDGWLITSISADDYEVLTKHVAPALVGLVQSDPSEDSSLVYPHVSFAFDAVEFNTAFVLWQVWDITSGGVEVEMV